ncbi:nicotinamide N-methyltransferase [Aspergillus nomiae NRRL 13137]|uniref:Nicotinamide N-methyltransferase n=1 Tax=Aspergillus nomiae NRRL (strain ATCC 15546 / NRRL 13137 / CBS 260.88 / M93) TaxID=1509407 RepID=A0A0L1IK63_ASPN3|nr:nicotinamide N-methyltransferase [Aspergillus nomiae NRRL 13137]KNG79944.1 nicotinamide N-methyltransferase [Aspergillus nomiae NRRL 13137]
MLHSRLRPLPRRRTPLSSSPSAPPPDFHDEDSVEDESPEDLFGAFLPHLFPDDAPSFHGDPGQHLLYSSPRYGALDIMVPSYPQQSDNHSEEIAAGLPRADGKVNDVDQGRRLFAHFLWSAAMVVAEGVENAEQLSSVGQLDSDTAMWNVTGESVLELGAGAALPSVVCALAQASTVTITDHPSSPAFAGAIAFNVDHNVRKSSCTTEVIIKPHEWGTLESDPWAVEKKGTFTRIIGADCYWMASQHENLVNTMKWFLAPGGKVWVVAGFHTGRAIVAGFFETAVNNGLEIERIYERDLNSGTEDGKEVRRDWVPEREGEGPENRKRWCVVALLRRKGE